MFLLVLGFSRHVDVKVLGRGNAVFIFETVGQCGDRARRQDPSHLKHGEALLLLTGGPGCYSHLAIPVNQSMLFKNHLIYC